MAISDEEKVLGNIKELLSERQFDEARILLGRIRNEAVTDVESRSSIGEAFRRAGMYDEAIEIYQGLHAVEPANDWYCFRLGYIHESIGQKAKAIDYYRLAIAINPDDENWRLNLGVLLYETGDLAGAVEAYRQSIAIRPEYTTPRLNLANALRELGCDDEAKATWELIAAEATSDSDRGDALYNIGDLLGAVDAYRRAIEAEPEDASARFDLGDILSELGRDDEARAIYEAIVAEAQFDSDRANALYRLGDLVGAVEAYRQSINSYPQGMDARFGLANALRKLGRNEEAKAIYEFILAEAKQEANRVEARECLNEMAK